jgi:hypothetical protein
MSTQFLLDEGDIKDLTKLMLVMIETQESRKQLCRELGINPQEVSFIIGTSDDTFCTELIDCLNRYGYQEYLCKLCCDKLFPILNKSAYSHRISILEKIIEKINCNCNHEQQNHSIPIDPHSDESKPESWLTKIGSINKKILAGGAIILMGLAGFSIVQLNTNSVTHSEDVRIAPDTANIEGKWISNWGYVSFKSNFTGDWVQNNPSILGEINRWNYNPETRELIFTYNYLHNHSQQINGTATLTLSEDGNILKGIWKQGNSSGEWVMNRVPS